MKPIRNKYCTDKLDLVIPYKCECCRQCWLYVKGEKTGTCPYGGPFSGYLKEKDDEK